MNIKKSTTSREVLESIKNEKDYQFYRFVNTSKPRSVYAFISSIHYYNQIAIREIHYKEISYKTHNDRIFKPLTDIAMLIISYLEQQGKDPYNSICYLNTIQRIENDDISRYVLLIQSKINLIIDEYVARRNDIHYPTKDDQLSHILDIIIKCFIQFEFNNDLE